MTPGNFVSVIGFSFCHNGNDPLALQRGSFSSNSHWQLSQSSSSSSSSSSRACTACNIRLGIVGCLKSTLSRACMMPPALVVFVFLVYFMLSVACGHWRIRAGGMSFENRKPFPNHLFWAVEWDRQQWFDASTRPRWH